MCSFLVYFSEELPPPFFDSQDGLCLPSRTEIILSISYKDKNRFVITVISPFLVNVSLAWYLLLLDFGRKGEVAEGLSAASPSIVLGNYERGLFTYSLMDLVALENGSPGWESKDEGQSSLSMYA